MDQWTPQEITAHMQYMQDFATRLEGTGEFVDSQGSPRRARRPLRRRRAAARHRRPLRRPRTDRRWIVIDVDSSERALELAGELSAAPGAGGKPITSGSGWAAPVRAPTIAE